MSLSNRHGRTVGIAFKIQASIKLLCKRLDKTGAQPGLFDPCWIRLADPIIGIVSFQSVSATCTNDDRRVLLRARECMLQCIHHQFSNDPPNAQLPDGIL